MANPRLNFMLAVCLATSASDVFAYLLHVTVDCDFENLVVDVDNFTTSASAMR